MDGGGGRWSSYRRQLQLHGDGFVNGMHHQASEWPLMWPLLVVEVVIFGSCTFVLLVSGEGAFEKRLLARIRWLAGGYLVYAPWVMVEQIATMAGTTTKNAVAMI